jgi:hypothetical protein
MAISGQSRLQHGIGELLLVITQQWLDDLCLAMWLLRCRAHLKWVTSLLILLCLFLFRWSLLCTLVLLDCREFISARRLDPKELCWLISITLRTRITF